MPDHYDWNLPADQLPNAAVSRLVNEALARVTSLPDAGPDLAMMALIVEMANGTFGGSGNLSADVQAALAGTAGSPSAANAFVTDSDTRLPDADLLAALAGSSGTPSAANVFVTDADTRLPDSNLQAALVGTSGTPSAANKFVTNADARLGGGTGLTGVSSAQNDGSLAGDGVTDDRAALNTLANTTLSGGGTIYFEPGTYLIGSDVTLPRNVTLWFARGATLKPSNGVTVTCLSQIVDCGHQIFDTTTTGVVRFAVTTTDNTNSNAAPATLPHLRPEWWGAAADKSTDSTTALQRCLDAACGWPSASQTYARYADGKVKLSSGYYKTTGELYARSVHGLVIEGAGLDNTYLIGFGGASGTADASGNTTTTLVKTGAGWTVNQWAGFQLRTNVGTASAGLARITSNTSDTLTFTPALAAAPDSATYRICVRSILELDGTQEAQLHGFTVEPDSTASYSYGIYYHREDTESALGASSSNFYNVKAGADFVYAGARIGSDSLASSANRQEDITAWFGCQFSNPAAWSSGSAKNQHGVYVGTGQFSNNIIHSFFGCKIVGFRYGLLVNGSSAYVHGGCIQSNDVDYRVENGAQHCLRVDGTRGEGSRMLFETSSSQTIPLSLTFDGVTMQQTALVNDATATLPIIGRMTMNGSLVLKDFRINSLDQAVTGTATSATGTTLVNSGASFPTTNGGYKGWRVEITGGTGAGQKRVVSSNTSTTLTVPTWTTTPDATSTYKVWPIPQIVVSGAANVEIEDAQVLNADLHEFLPSLSSFSRASVRRYRRLFADGTANASEYYDVDVNPTATYNRAFRAAAVAGSKPDVWMARSRTGTYGISQLETGNFRVRAIGTTAAPFADKGGSHTAGATAHTYYLVAKDGSGNKALCSVGVAVTACLATLTATDYVRVYLNTSAADWAPAAKYDLLVERSTNRDGLAPSSPQLLAADLTPADLQTYRDEGQPTLGAYTVPTSDATGTWQLDGRGVSKVFPVSKTGNYTLTTSDDVIHVDATSGNLTMTLPAVASAVGSIFTIRKVDSGANTVTIDGNGAETINGATTYVLAVQYESVTVYNNGTEWFA